MKKSKQILSFIISVIMLFSALAFENISSAAEYYEQEDNNTANRADTIPLNSSMSGISTSSSDADWFKFTTTKNGKIDISFSHDFYSSYGGCWKIYLYKDTGNETRSEYDNMTVYFDSGTGSFPSYGLRPGTYYLHVYANSSNNIKYKVNVNFTATEAWEKEGNDTAHSANTIKLNSSLSGISTNSNDDDWFKFTITKNGKIDISFSHDFYSSYGNCWNIYLYKDTGNETRSEYDNMTVYFDSGTGSFPSYGLRPGTYYLKVHADSSNSVKYNISVKYTATESWEKEKNDTAHDANLIKLNSSLTGISTSASDDDWFKFTITQNSKVDISLSHDFYSSYGGCWKIYLYKDTGNETRSEYDNMTVYFDSGTGSFPTYGLRPGTYFLHVYANSSNKIKYTLKVSTPVDKPSSFKVSSYTSTSIKLKWSSVSGATGYQLQRKVDGSYKTVKTTTSTSYNVTELPKGKSQTFRVRAYISSNGTKIYGKWVTLTAATSPSATRISSLVTGNDHKITAQWTKVSNASGYQVRISTTKDFKKYTSASVGSSAKTKTFSNLSKGKTYYLKVRSYKKVNDKKYYSDWSKVVNIKCK